MKDAPVSSLTMSCLSEGRACDKGTVVITYMDLPELGPENAPLKSMAPGSSYVDTHSLWDQLSSVAQSLANQQHNVLPPHIDSFCRLHWEQRLFGGLE